MQFRETKLKGVWLITLEPRMDDRGFFMRTFCENEFAAQGLNTRWPQCNHTLTREKGSVRGLHYQAEPRPEIKTVRCVRGSIFDVVVDLRAESDTYGKWEAFELSPGKNQMIYIGAGFAHGFQTLEADSEVLYQMSEFYYSDLARGVRWNDPALMISWPIPASVVSERDQQLPFLSELNPKSSGLGKKVD